jgi:phosphoheptose isomerase
MHNEKCLNNVICPIEKSHYICPVFKTKLTQKMTKNEIFRNKKLGDIKQVAEILGVSHANADKILRRVNSKKHAEAFNILKNIVESREALKKSYNK